MIGDKGKGAGTGERGAVPDGASSRLFPSTTPDSRPPTPRHGFTLIEVLVGLAIFMTVSVIVADIFLLSTRAENRVGAQETLSAAARTVTDRIVQTARSGALDYASMAIDAGGQAGTLALTDAAGTPYAFSATADVAACGASTPPCVAIAQGAVVAPLTPPGITVTDLRFFVSPASDPFVLDPSTGTYAADAQPTVTIVLGLQDAAGRAVRVQTTVTTRQYVR